MVKDGELIVQGGGDPPQSGYLVSDRSYADFILRFEFMMSLGRQRGGLPRRARRTPHGRPISAPISINNMSDPEQTGTLFWSTDINANDKVSPDRPARLNAAGSWNAMEIEIRGQDLRAAVNGQDILETNLKRFERRPRSVARRAPDLGRIGFQGRPGAVSTSGTSGSIPIPPRGTGKTARNRGPVRKSRGRRPTLRGVPEWPQSSSRQSRRIPS